MARNVGCPVIGLFIERERRWPGCPLATGSHVAHLEFNREFRAAARNRCGRRLAR
jgi:hypothetical protein